MTDIQPFRALRYSKQVEWSKVLAPVYDVVAPEDRALHGQRPLVVGDGLVVRSIIVRDDAQVPESLRDVRVIPRMHLGQNGEGLLVLVLRLAVAASSTKSVAQIEARAGRVL